MFYARKFPNKVGLIRMHSSRMPACCPYLPACTARVVYLVLGGCTWSGWGGGTCLGGGGYLPRYSLSPVNRMTDRCKNITLPQTSFAGGNKATYLDVLRIRLNFCCPHHEPNLKIFKNNCHLHLPEILAATC